MKSRSDWQPGQALHLIVGQAVMLVVTVLLVLGSCAVVHLAQS